MEYLKPLALVHEPDKRNVWRRYSLEFFHSTAAKFELLPSVPESVRYQFEVARHAYIYTWFYHPLSAAAELYAILAIEHALSIVYDKRKKPRKPGQGPHLKGLLSVAIKESWIQDSGFDMHFAEQILTPNGIEERPIPPERAPRPTQVVLKALPDIRNALAHGEPTLTVEAVSNSLQRAAEIINQLFPEQRDE